MQNNTVQALLQWAREYLVLARIENAALDSEVLLRTVCGWTRAELLLNLQAPLAEADVKHFRRLVRLRCEHVPLQYLTGEQEFMGLPFHVTPAVFIPRSDTEILVNTVIDLLQGPAEVKLVDVGTGSGIIAVSLAKYLPQATVWATDIAAKALEVARYNAVNNAVDTRIIFREGNLLEPVLAAGEALGQFDAIVTNPPYIPTAEIPFLQPEVLREPSIALDGGDDGLDYYRALIPQSRQCLRDSGYFACEIGCDQGAAVQALAEAHGFGEVRIKQDYAGRDRVVVARKC